LAERLVANGRDTARRFCWEAVCPRLREVYAL
jgi:hypothetical protein